MMTKIKPQKVRVIDRTEHQSLEDFANTLESIATKIKNDGKFLIVEGEKVTDVIPGSQLKVEYKYSTKAKKHKFEIEFKWLEGDSGKLMIIE